MNVDNDSDLNKESLICEVPYVCILVKTDKSFVEVCAFYRERALFMYHNDASPIDRRSKDFWHIDYTSHYAHHCGDMLCN